MIQGQSNYLYNVDLYTNIYKQLKSMYKHFDTVLYISPRVW